MRIGIFGAGSIGCHVGGLLAAAGKNPVLVGRGSMAARLAGGIELTSHDGTRKTAPAGSFVFSPDPQALAQCDCVFVCVKSTGTHEAAQTLKRIVKPECTLVSLQNGIANAQLLRDALPGHRVLAGMVGFNIAQIGDNRFHCGTEGEIVLEDGNGALAIAAQLLDAAVPVMVRRDIEAVQWGKLLLNLNNAVNALSGLPLKRQLSGHAWRKLLALSVREAIKVLRAAGIRPAKLGKVSPRLIPAILQLPDWLFSRVAASMLKIDDEARSSMAEDLEKGRPPEIEFLNGEIVALGKRHGVATPVNAEIIAAVMQLFSQKPPVHPEADEMLARFRSLL